MYPCVVRVRSLVLRIEHRWNFFEYMFLKTSFGTKIQNATSSWEKLSDSELQNVQSSPYGSIRAVKLRRMKRKGSGRNEKCTQSFSW